MRASLIVVKAPGFGCDACLLLTRARADALYVFPNSINHGHDKTILEFATANRLPTAPAKWSFSTEKVEYGPMGAGA